VNKKGHYIFDAPGKKAVMLGHKAVSSKLGRGEWFKDRSYPHKFLTVGDIRPNVD